MTGMDLPHAPIFPFPDPRQPHPAEVMPELYADPAFTDRPVDLICELADCWGEDMAVAMWCWAHIQLPPPVMAARQLRHELNQRRLRGAA